MFLGSLHSIPLAIRSLSSGKEKSINKYYERKNNVEKTESPTLGVGIGQDGREGSVVDDG